MTSKEELWRKAYEWMQRYGDQMPDARMRSLYDPPSFRHLPRWASHWEPTPMPDIMRPLMSLDEVREKYFGGSFLDDTDFMKQYQGTFDNFNRLPDSFSNTLGQPGSVDPDELKEIHQLIQKAWPQPHAAYSNQDGTYEMTEILEDTDELCPCGATWRHDDCEHT